MYSIRHAPTGGVACVSANDKDAFEPDLVCYNSTNLACGLPMKLGINFMDGLWC